MQVAGSFNQLSPDRWTRLGRWKLLGWGCCRW
jgi:hypothetical protein